MLAWDNMPYAGLLLASYARAWSDPTFFCTWEPVVRRALAFVPLSGGLAHNDPTAPNCSFGFEDSVVMPGRMLTVSLLMYDAATQLAALSKQTGCGDIAFYNGLASGVSSGVDALYDTGGSGIFLASDDVETIPDVFGSAYLVTLGLSTQERRSSVSAFLASQWQNSSLARVDTTTKTIWQEGQARHLPYPLLWRQCWGGGCPQAGTYQNGAFWATPLNWLLPALVDGGFEVEATAIASAAVTSFQRGGVMEAINTDIGYTGVRDYVASACNLFGVVAPAGANQLEH